MQIRISEDELYDLVAIDAGDHTWWVEDQISNRLESLLDIINKRTQTEKELIHIVPEEKYLNCTCQFHKVRRRTNYDSRWGPHYEEKYEHLKYCKEHEDERVVN